MKQALVAPNEPVFNYDEPPVQIGERIAETAIEAFPVAPPLFWVECEDDVVADQFYWDGTACVPVPPRPAPVSNVTETQVPNGPTVIQ